VKLVAKFAAGGVDTGAKFATGVVCLKIRGDIRSSRFTIGVVDNGEVMATISKRRRNETSILTSFSILKRNEPAYSRTYKD
jgi:hypothetical protein